MQHGAVDAVVLPRGVDQRLRAGDDARRHVGMAVEVLRGAVQHEVVAEVERTLVVGRGEGVVGDGEGAGGVGDGGGGAQISEVHRRVAGRLGVDDLRVGLDGTLERLGLALIHLRHRDAVAREDLGEEGERAGVVRGLGDDVIALLEMTEDGGGDGGHAGA
jgi:hypothetical protein